MNFYKDLMIKLNILRSLEKKIYGYSIYLLNLDCSIPLEERNLFSNYKNACKENQTDIIYEIKNDFNIVGDYENCFQEPLFEDYTYVFKEFLKISKKFEYVLLYMTKTLNDRIFYLNNTMINLYNKYDELCFEEDIIKNESYPIDIDTDYFKKIPTEIDEKNSTESNIFMDYLDKFIGVDRQSFDRRKRQKNFGRSRKLKFKKLRR